MLADILVKLVQPGILAKLVKLQPIEFRYLIVAVKMDTLIMVRNVKNAIQIAKNVKIIQQNVQSVRKDT